MTGNIACRVVARSVLLAASRLESQAASGSSRLHLGADPHPDLQPFEAVQAARAFAIDRPALAPQ